MGFFREHQVFLLVSTCPEPSCVNKYVSDVPRATIVTRARRWFVLRCCGDGWCFSIGTVNVGTIAITSLAGQVESVWRRVRRWRCARHEALMTLPHVRWRVPYLDCPAQLLLLPHRLWSVLRKQMTLTFAPLVCSSSVPSSSNCPWPFQ